MDGKATTKFMTEVPIPKRELSLRTITKRRRDLYKQHLKVFRKDTKFQHLQIPTHLRNVKLINDSEGTSGGNISNEIDISENKHLYNPRNIECKNNTISQSGTSGSEDANPHCKSMMETRQERNNEMETDNEVPVIAEETDNDSNAYGTDHGNSTTSDDTDNVSATEREEQSPNDSSDDDNNVFAMKNDKGWTEKLRLRNDITKVHAIASAISVGIRSNLTYAAIMQSIRNLGSMFVGSTLPRTLNGFWSMLSRNDKTATTRHYYCRECPKYLGKNYGQLDECECETSETHTTRDSLSYFIQVNLAPQLRQLFPNPTIVDSLQHRHKRTKKDENALEDIYDGTKYKQFCERGGFLSNKNNFSFTLNTDGCKVSKSSNASAWPILIQINELPPHARKRHILLAGVWVDVVHPDLNVLLMPTMLELKDLYDAGITWKHPINKSCITSKFITLICTVDTPARSDVLNMTRFNGRYGCTFCYAEGKTVLGKGVRRVFPTDGTAPRRTDADMRLHMNEAFTQNKRVFGTKGLTSLMILPVFDLSIGMIVESMHNMYSGVAKLHTTLLIKGNAKDPWYIGTPTIITAINNTLMSIRRPSKISRNPRVLEEMSNWKASEWRNWLLYYVLICLEGKCCKSDIKMLALLSRAAYILNADSINVQELNEARLLLQQYVTDFEERFGIRNMKFNVHLLTHLCETVENWGPVWAHSAFPFEAWNKKIIERITAANSRSLQIVTRHLMNQFVEGLIHDQTVPKRTKKMITATLTDGLKTTSIHMVPTSIQSKMQGIGSGQYRSPCDWELEALHSIGLDAQTLLCYKKAKVHNVHYNSYRQQTGKAETRYCNEYVYCESIGFARILEIVELRHNDEEIRGFFVQLLYSESNAFGAQHIQNVQLSSKKEFVCTDLDVPVPAIIISTDMGLRAIKLPNIWETD